MEKRITLELRGRKPSQVEELNLDNCRSTQIIALTDEYTNLESLSLNSVGLTTLKGFPTLPKLRKLELSDNRISNGLNFLSGCKKLAHLNLSGNMIKDFDTLKPLKEFKHLKYLDLFNNKVTSIDDYRNIMFTLQPSLKYLDGFDRQDAEAEETTEEEDDMNGNVSSEEASEDEDDDEDVSLSAVYNDNLEEESSAGSLYEGSVDDEEDEDVDYEDDADGEHNSKVQDGETDLEPEESTRGKKRKHEDDDEEN